MPSQPTNPLQSESATRSRRPGRPRSAEGSPEVRAALLDAATQLAIERGFDSVGLREIAERAGASPAMISYYFGDREGLYQALFQRAFDQMSELVAALLDPERAAEASVEELIRVHVSALARDPWIPQLIAREVLARSTSVREEFVRQSDGPMTLMVGWMEREIERGRVRSDLDAELIVMSILSLSVFPYLFAPIAGPRFGFELDDAFRDRLIAHNQRLIHHGIRAPETTK